MLPNNTILNIISKAKQEPYKQFVLEMFNTDEKIVFKYDNPRINYLYLNGVIDREKIGVARNVVIFSCRYVQKRLFNYFSDELFNYMGKLVDPFENTKSLITKRSITIKNVIKRYEKYLKKNRAWLLKKAPRRKDLRVFEAIYHFNFFMYLYKFLTPQNAEVYPEFPTGNGKIDIVIKYAGKIYGIEIKSFTDERRYKEALSQAADYGKQLNISEISLVFFVEYIDAENRRKFEAGYFDKKSKVSVVPIFIETGSD